MTMMGSYSEQQPQALYNDFPSAYSHRHALPHSRLEYELVQRALGDCTNARVLDLAGGSGDHARTAIDAGARQVDLVDVSMAMMEIGEEIEAKADRDVIRWIMGDVTLPLHEQVIIPALPKGGYDVVLAIWPFHHAGTLEAYEGIWRNIATYLKPGGQVVGCRLANPWSLSLQTRKYGAAVRLTEPIPGGVKCHVEVGGDEPFAFEATSLEESLMGHRDVPEMVGIGEVQILRARETKTVRENVVFWGDFVDDPYFVVFTGRKMGG
ncbi:hypothetical protein M409DRAFT_26843 [Zasmidium cellare ATCC 36951]|uniref:Methyltransferase domain-containing protein n=1 Tax=Zasmidium cellare ATCC 36951 TaxID=1080233 RepID=A0A6A6C6B3_ZASCE|nr:uncharacterized protein M409DRAFT_26843 [Zasmidium cellare ATCC 36951]KAF2162601.1 hypothetical protein M409DRAFT_26843 [Zasmidium cellare ATCC 36951]